MLEAIYNFLPLTDSIATAGQPSAGQIAEIAERGFEVVINLGLDEAEYALANEEALVNAHGMEYIYLPVIWERPTEFDLDRFCEIMDANKDKKTFVHCAANMRVSVFMALYRILRLGWPEEKACKHIEQIWTPNAIWQAFIEGTLRRNRLRR
jgi:uncharacterized protein (TIGR01244 family)